MSEGHVVVTGAAGFIGSHVVGALLDEGHEVVGIDALTPFYAPEEKRANLAGLLARPGFRLVEGDLAELDLDQWLTGAAAVVHEAGQPGVSGSWGAAFAAYAHHNILATQWLLEACARTGVPRLVAASSSSVYGDAPTYPTTEESTTRPVSPYGVTKLAAEHLCMAYAQPAVSDMAVVALRYFSVYGPRQRPDMAFRRFLEAAWDGEPVTLFGDGAQTRDFTFVGDAVRATLLAMTAPVKGDVVNVGGGRRVTVDEVIDLVGRVSGRPLRVERQPARAGDAAHTGADGTRAEALLGFHPQVDLEDGLAAQAAWVADRRRGRVSP
jgi:nucleoside-diphosphate-sugar epimerase